MFCSGWVRLAVVFVVLVEMLIVIGTVHAWTELNEAEQRLAGLTVPPPEEEAGELTAEDLLNPPPPAETARLNAEYGARNDYSYAAATVETRKSELYIFLAALIAFPLAFACAHQVLFWVIAGFRRQPV